MSYKTEMGRVIGLGSAREGTHDWWLNRLTSVALIPLTLIFLCTVAPQIGNSRAELVAQLQSPFTAICTILFLLVGFRHLADGLKEVIVDYVHAKAPLVVLLVLARLGCYFLGFAGAYAVAQIALGA
jgi:succinate dehydrogenase / fumarate reductase membrane anchor subunit